MLVFASWVLELKVFVCRHTWHTLLLFPFKNQTVLFRAGLMGSQLGGGTGTQGLPPWSSRGIPGLDQGLGTEYSRFSEQEPGPVWEARKSVIPVCKNTWWHTITAKSSRQDAAFLGLRQGGAAGLPPAVDFLKGFAFHWPGDHWWSCCYSQDSSHMTWVDISGTDYCPWWLSSTSSLLTVFPWFLYPPH